MSKDTEPSEIAPVERSHKVSTPRHKVSDRRTRRTKGTGAVVHRADGRWFARLKLPDGTDRSFYGKTQGEVERRLDEARGIIASGSSLPDNKLTVRRWFEEWLEGLSVNRLKASTIAYYRRYVEVHLFTADFANKPLAKLEASDLARLYRRMMAPKSDGGLGLSSTTAHHLHAVIHNALARAVWDDKIGRNVAERVHPNDRPPVDHTEMKVLAGDEYDRFLAAVRGQRLEALFVTAIGEGLRQGELLALRWKDVDLDARTLTVAGSLAGRRRSLLTVTEPKTAKSRRTIDLRGQTVEALREHRRRQAEEQLRAGSWWIDRGLVFSNERGDYLSTTTLTRSLHAILEGAGLPRVRFHDLRHSAATHWGESGMDAKLVSKRLGHSGVQITLDLYTHVTPTWEREAVDELDRRDAARRNG